MTDYRLDGKCALVTGASSGIGAKIASELATAGVDVILIGRDKQRLAAVGEHVRSLKRRCEEIAIDLTATGAIEEIASVTESTMPGIDVLVHSAGIYEPRAFCDVDAGSLDRQWQINVRAPFLLTRALLSNLRPRASVIFLSSVDGHAGFAGDSAYAATKGAIDALTRALAMELAARDIRVNAVAPGFTATPMNERARADRNIVDPVLRSTPAQRLATVDDVSSAVLFLASEASAFVLGVVLPVDGGYPAAEAQLPRLVP